MAKREVRVANAEVQPVRPSEFASFDNRNSSFDIQTLQELDRLEDEADQLVAITVASKKTARGGND